MASWTYTRPLDRPAWVRDCTRLCGTALLLVRRSGDQEIRLGETIIAEVGGEIAHEIKGALT